MLIHLDSTAADDAVSNTATTARSHAAIENLLLAHFEGYHVISLLPEDAARLCMASLSWSARARRALEHIEESYAQIAGLRADVPWALELGLGPSFDSTIHDPSSGGKVLRAPLLHFEKSHQAACAMLLGENMADADLLREIGLMMREHRRWEHIKMSYDARGAGGSTLAQEYKQVADRGRIVLAFADSDKGHPKAGFGETYSQLDDEARGRPAYQRARPLPTRTAEALVPLSFYQEAFQFPREHGDQRLGSVARLEQFLRAASDTVWYADFKRGLTLHQVEHAENEAERSYWGDVARRVKRDQCTRSSREQCTKPKDCGCHVVDALGKKALSAVVKWMQARKSKKDLASRFMRPDAPELSALVAALADEVLSWGLALSPLMT